MKRTILHCLAGAVSRPLGWVATLLFGPDESVWCPYCGYACGCKRARS